jgi:hypothetical protein
MAYQATGDTAVNAAIDRNSISYILEGEPPEWDLIWDGGRSPRERAISLLDGWVLMLPVM